MSWGLGVEGRVGVGEEVVEGVGRAPGGDSGGEARGGEGARGGD